jgi:hypothetical protein
MHKKWIAVNLALLVATGAAGWQLRTSIRSFWDANDLSRLQPRDPKGKGGEDGLPRPAAVRTYTVPEFAAIPGQNLFAETRSRDEKVETPVVQETPPLANKPLLVGVTISDSQRLAAVVDPQVNQPAGAVRKSQTKRVGDSYQGYTITDITSSAMVLELGTRREVIPLFDPAKRPQGGGKTNIAATRIVAFGAGSGGGAPGGAPVVATGAPARAAATAPAVANVGGGSAAATAKPQTPQPGITRQTPGAPTAATPWNQSTDGQGRRVIRTPFGDIVRDEPPQE